MARLALVTCGPLLEVALTTGTPGAVSVVRLAGVSRRSSLLLAAVDLLFEDAALGPQALDSVIVTRGPGSFTGIRSGLATAAGLAAALGCAVVAYDSLLCQAARLAGDGRVWAAQPGRRGEVYARHYELRAGAPPVACSELTIMTVADLGRCGPWLAPDPLDLGPGLRAQAARGPAEALLWLASAGVAGDPVEPLYVEGPPVVSADVEG